MKFGRQCFFMIIGCFFLSGCYTKTVTGNGKIISQTRKLGAFDRVHALGVFKLIIKHGDQNSVLVKVDENLQSYVQTANRGGLLDIKVKPGVVIYPHNGLSVIVTEKTLKSLSLYGDINGRLEGVLSPTLAVDVSGLSHLALSGKTNQLNLLVTGHASIDAGGLASKNATINGAGIIRVLLNMRSGKLSVQTSGRARISYVGHIGILHQHATGDVQITRAPDLRDAARAIHSKKKVKATHDRALAAS